MGRDPFVLPRPPTRPALAGLVWRSHNGRTMVTLTFTAHLQRHFSCPRHQVDAATLGDALEQVFANQPQARSCILDDQGALRQHVAVFIDGRRAQDRLRLGDALRPGAEVHVLQALTGG